MLPVFAFRAVVQQYAHGRLALAWGAPSAFGLAGAGNRR